MNLFESIELHASLLKGFLRDYATEKDCIKYSIAYHILFAIFLICVCTDFANGKIQ